ncbi:MAG: FAD-dependent oxidoreductase, partial [Candidatus Uhrbacteria bacterium]|nr:FAD-dependent oxidoreductase [Candidatus Uhrbacteria bacterium]
VTEIVWETAEIFTLELEPQNPADRVSFKPGQWAYLHLLEKDGTPWARAAYSLASAPEESKDRLKLGIKLEGDFTKRASKLMPDDVVSIQGPFGVFVVPPGDEPLVMFAAGIGITPLRSMIRSLDLQGTSRPVTLFYSNKTIEAAAYFEDFDALAKRADWFTPVFTLTRGAPSDWPAETGRIDGAMFDRHVSSFENAVFFMCGPKPFMDGIRRMLEERGIDTRKRLKQELFG